MLYDIGEMFFHLNATNGFYLKVEMKDLLLRACVLVTASNMKISRRRLADYVKEKYFHTKEIKNLFLVHRWVI